MDINLFSEISLNNSYLNIFINIIILLGMSILIPGFCVLIISLFKIKINKKFQIYLSSFTCGLILILGTVGFLGEAITHSKEHFETNPTNILSILQIIGVVGGGSIISIGLILLAKWLLSKNKHDLHEDHSIHGHSDAIFNAKDIDNNKIKWLPVILLFLHRSVDGITLGLMSNTQNNLILNFENWGMIIIFIVHLIPTSIIIYFIQLDIHKNNRIKAFGYTILMSVVIIPFAFVGGYLSSIFNTAWWLMPLLYSISGCLMTIMTIMEIIPEFIHYRNAQIKEWMLIITFLGLGILLSIILLSIHSHDHGGAEEIAQINNIIYSRLVL